MTKPTLYDTTESDRISALRIALQLTLLRESPEDVAEALFRMDAADAYEIVSVMEQAAAEIRAATR